MLKYPILKTRYLEIAKNQDKVSVLFSNAYLIVGIIAPEASPQSQDAVNRINLFPYEHACRQFSNSDYQYSEVDLNSAGSRDLLGLLRLGNESTSNTQLMPLIVCYLEFKN